MTKRNANNAIDFNKLLAVKNHLPSVAQVTAPIAADPLPSVGTINVATGAREEEGESSGGTVLEFSPRDPVEPLPTTQSAVETVPPPEQVRQPFALPAGTVVLRLGMSRSLHERVRACAALDGRTPAELARDLIERRTPVFPRTSSMASLAKEARESFPMCETRKRVDVRMQVPVEVELHRRLRQLAALRAQTLVACVADLFEASVPSM